MKIQIVKKASIKANNTSLKRTLKTSLMNLGHLLEYPSKRPRLSKKNK